MAAELPNAMTDVAQEQFAPVNFELAPDAAAPSPGIGISPLTPGYWQAQIKAFRSVDDTANALGMSGARPLAPVAQDDLPSVPENDVERLFNTMGAFAAAPGQGVRDIARRTMTLTNAVSPISDDEELKRFNEIQTETQLGDENIKNMLRRGYGQNLLTDALTGALRMAPDVAAAQAAAWTTGLPVALSLAKAGQAAGRAGGAAIGGIATAEAGGVGAIPGSKVGEFLGGVGGFLVGMDRGGKYGAFAYSYTQSMAEIYSGFRSANMPRARALTYAMSAAIPAAFLEVKEIKIAAALGGDALKRALFNPKMQKEVSEVLYKTLTTVGAISGATAKETAIEVLQEDVKQAAYLFADLFEADRTTNYFDLKKALTANVETFQQSVLTMGLYSAGSLGAGHFAGTRISESLQKKTLEKYTQDLAAADNAVEINENGRVAVRDASGAVIGINTDYGLEPLVQPTIDEQQQQEQQLTQASVQQIVGQVTARQEVDANGVPIVTPAVAGAVELGRELGVIPDISTPEQVSTQIAAAQGAAQQELSALEGGPTMEQIAAAEAPPEVQQALETLFPEGAPGIEQAFSEAEKVVDIDNAPDFEPTAVEALSKPEIAVAAKARQQQQRAMLLKKQAIREKVTTGKLSPTIAAQQIKAVDQALTAVEADITNLSSAADRVDLTDAIVAVDQQIVQSETEAQAYLDANADIPTKVADRIVSLQEKRDFLSDQLAELDAESPYSVDPTYARKLSAEVKVGFVGQKLKAMARSYRRQLAQLQTQNLRQAGRTTKTIKQLQSQMIRTMRQAQTAELRGQKQVDKAAQKAAREQNAITKNLIASTQKQMRNLIQASELTKADQAKFLAKIPAVQTPEQFNKQLRNLQLEIDKTIDRTRAKTIAGKVQNLLKRRAALLRGGKRPQGKYDAEIQRVLDNFSVLQNTKKLKAESAALRPFIDNAMVSPQALVDMLADPAKLQLAQAIVVLDPAALDSVLAYEDAMYQQAVTTTNGMIQYPSNAVSVLVQTASALQNAPFGGADYQQRLLDALTTLITKGAAIAARRDAAEKQRIADIDALLNKTLPDKPVAERGSHRNFTERAKYLGSGFLAIGDSWATFLELLNVKGKAGALAKKFGTFKEFNAYTFGVRKNVTELANQVEQTLKRFGDFQSFDGYLQEVSNTRMTPQFIMPNGQIFDGGELSIDELAYIWGQFQAAKTDPRIAEQLEKAGYSSWTSQAAASMEAWLDGNLPDKHKAVVETYFKFNDKYYDSYSDWYAEHFYVYLGRRKNYLPISTVGEKQSKADILERDYTRRSLVPVSARHYTGAGKIRITGAGEAMLGYIRSVEHGKAYYDKFRDIQTAFKNMETRQRIENALGQQVVAVLDYFMDNGALNLQAESRFRAPIVETAAQALTVAWLGAKTVKQIATQWASTHLYLLDIPFHLRPLYILKTIPNLAKNAKAIAQNPVIQDRFSNIARTYNIAVHPNMSMLSKRKSTLTDALLMANAIGDLSSAALGGGAVLFQYYKDQGLSDTDAAIEVANVSEATQASGNPAETPWVIGGTGTFGRIQGLMMSQIMQMYRLTAAEVIRFNRSRKTPADFGRLMDRSFAYWFSTSFTASLVGSIVTFLPGGGEDDEDRRWLALWRAITRGATDSISGAPLIGEVMNYAAVSTLNQVFKTKEPVFKPGNRFADFLLSPIAEMQRIAKKVIGKDEATGLFDQTDNELNLTDAANIYKRILAPTLSLPQQFGTVIQAYEQSVEEKDPVAFYAALLGWTMEDIQTRKSAKATGLFGGKEKAVPIKDAIEAVMESLNAEEEAMAPGDDLTAVEQENTDSAELAPEVTQPTEINQLLLE